MFARHGPHMQPVAYQCARSKCAPPSSPSDDVDPSPPRSLSFPFSLSLSLPLSLLFFLVFFLFVLLACPRSLLVFSLSLNGYESKRGKERIRKPRYLGLKSILTPARSRFTIDSRSPRRSRKNVRPWQCTALEIRFSDISFLRQSKN